MRPICRRLLQFKRSLSLSTAKMSTENPYGVYSNPESPNAQSKLPDSEFLRFESRQDIRVITLDRPAALHALNFSMVSDLGAAMRTFSNSETAKAIVFRGSPIESGKKSFCAGGDVVRTQQDLFLSY